MHYFDMRSLLVVATAFGMGSNILRKLLFTFSGDVNDWC